MGRTVVGNWKARSVVSCRRDSGMIICISASGGQQRPWTIRHVTHSGGCSLSVDFFGNLIQLTKPQNFALLAPWASAATAATKAQQNGVTYVGINVHG